MSAHCHRCDKTDCNLFMLCGACIEAKYDAENSMRARLEKVRDELKVSRQKDKEVLSHNCYSTVCCENALRMLEEILEGK